MLDEPKGSIYSRAGIPEDGDAALHDLGHTSWDCPRCGQDPEDCWCEGEGDARDYGISEPWRVTSEDIGMDFFNRRTRLTLYRGDDMVGVVEFSRLHEVDGAANTLRIMVSTYETLRIAELARIQAEKESAFSGEWRPGDPCGVCGSTETGWNPVSGGHCRSCKSADSDE